MFKMLMSPYLHSKRMEELLVPDFVVISLTSY
jgi:hypothetical protein